MALNYVILTLDLVDGSGAVPAAGTASFTPSAVLTDSGVEMAGQQPVTATFTPAGAPQVRLLATDNTGVQPAGWAWKVTFAGITGGPAAFSFFLPFAAGSSQVLSAQAPVQAVTQFQPYVPMTATKTAFLAQPAASRVIAHRGLLQVAPENTLVAYRAAMAQMAALGFVPAIKTDVWLLADGTLGVMHDSSVNRTTTSTGNNITFTAQTWKTLVANPALVGPAWSSDGQGMVLLTDLLQDLGGRCFMVIEPKNLTSAAVTAACNAITARGLAASCVLTGQDTTLTLPPVAKAAGLDWWFYWNSAAITSPTPAQVIATPGVTALGIICNQGNSYTDADITTVVTAAHNAGLLATGSTYVRRYDYARGVSFGMDAHTVNDLAVTGTTAMLTSDLWAVGAPVPGEVGTTTPATASASYPSYAYSGGTANYQRRIDGSVNGSGVGEACTFLSPAANSGPGKVYTLTISVFFEATETQSSDGGRFAWVGIGFPDDRLFSANPQAPGYNILLRQGGGSSFTNPTFQVMKQVPGAYNGDGTYAIGTSTQQGANLASTTGYAAPNTLGTQVSAGTVTSVTLGSAVTVPTGIKIKFANGQITSVSSPVTASTTVPVTSFVANATIASGSAVYFGIPCSFKLDATVANQTTLTVKRTDTNDTLTTTDTNTGGTGPYNGGYIHIGKTGTGAGSTLAVSFAQATVT